jgi:hypothetical protein
MDYRCPHCHRMLSVRGLFFRDISACAKCGQKVVLGDFLAFFMAAVSMLVSALTALYVLSQEQEYFVAAGYALTIGMLSGIAVLLLLGRATAFRKAAGKRKRARMPAGGPAVKS